MIKRLLLLLMAMLPSALWAADGDEFNKDNIYYRVLSETAKTCQVYSYLHNGYYDMVIPEQVNGYTVVSVRDSAFLKSRNLASITFPKTIKRIGKYACYDSYQLYSVTIQGCDTICDYAFCDSHNLTTVNIEDGVKWIGDYAFMVYYYQWRPYDPYSSPSEYALPNSVEHIGKCAFAHNKQLVNVVLPRHLSKISERMFDDCPNLKSVEGIQWENVDSIERNAFGCQYLESEINITNATYVGQDAFSGCNKATIRFSEKLKNIGDDAFNGCHGLVSPLHITKDMTIGNNCFVGCSNVESINVDEGVSAYCPTNGCNALIKYGGWISDSTIVLGCAKTTIPSSVKVIGSGAFAYCKELKTIPYSSSVFLFDDRAFEGCEGLKEVTIPPTVENLGFGVFENCTNLEAVYINSPTIFRSLPNSYAERYFKKIGHTIFPIALN
ncbi:MAG: leucine-rich repeat domain-containing protein [Bacteroidaceae bacterium]|nr:leucine-rich repeat domain-containing protein [Bacteroidaceae bacterium]